MRVNHQWIYARLLNWEDFTTYSVCRWGYRIYNTLVRILVATFKLEKNCSLLWKCMKVGMTENCVGTARGWDALLSSCSSCCNPFGGRGHVYFGTSRSWVGTQRCVLTRFCSVTILWWISLWLFLTQKQSKILRSVSTDAFIDTKLFLVH